jgi:tetratricopeptide (TPR) repeat protein
MKKTSFYICAILWMVSITAAASPLMQAPSTAVEQLLSKARALEGRGRLDLAAQAWEQTLLADPANVDALLGLAKFAKQNGKVEEANHYLQMLRNVDPKNPSIGRVEGMTSTGRQRSGIDEAGRLAASQNFEAAMRIYRGLFGNDPPPGGVAISYYETEAATPGGWEDAVAGIERLAAKYPLSEEYRLSLGRLKTYRQPTRLQGMEILEAVKGDMLVVNKARAAWRQALVWSAGNAASLPSLQAYLARYPDPEIAKLISHAPKTEEAAVPRPLAPPDNVEAGLGYSSLKASKLNEAEKHFRAALKATPHNASALAGLGFVQMKQEDFHGAAESFQQALSAQPKNKNTVEALGTARFWEQMKAGANALNQNEPDTALTHFENARALRPANVQAAESIAGAYMLQRKPALAVPLYERLVQLKPQNLDYWYGLVKAEYQSGKPAEALASLKQAPPQVKAQWGKDPEHLALLSFIYADAGEIEQAKRIFHSATVAAGSNKSELPVDLQLEFAGLLLRLGNSRQAAEAFELAATKHPADVDAWIGSINALLQVPDAARAYEVLQRMPQNAYAVAANKPDFLRSVARLQASLQRYDLAEKSLNKAAELDGAEGRRPDLEGQLQLADLYVRMQNTSRAEALLRVITEEHPTDQRAWSQLMTLLHAAKADQAALAEMEKIPEKVAAEAQNEAGFVALQAAVYIGSGHKNEALLLVQNARRKLESQGREVSAALDIQMAWLLLNNRGSQSELYRILERTGNRPGLTGTERSDLNQIWSVWCQRRAQTAIDNGDFQKAIPILQAAALLLPQDAGIQGTLASTFVRTADFQKSFDVYQRWDLKGADADDFRGAVGSASVLHKDTLAAAWLERGLRRYPDNSLLLQLAGEKAAQRGEYKLADIYLRRALLHLPPEGRAVTYDKVGSGQAGQQPLEIERTLGHLLLETSADAGSTSLDHPPVSESTAVESGDPLVQEQESDRGVLPPMSALPSSHAFREPSDSAVSPLFDASFIQVDSRPDSSGLEPVHVQAGVNRSVLDTDSDGTPAPTAQAAPSSRAFTPGNDFAGTPAEREPAEAVPATPKKTGQLELRQQIEGDLEAVAGRNTPFFRDGVNLNERSGQGGFDKLMIEEADIEASVTVSDRVRLSLIARPTYVDSGSQASTSHLGFGTTAVDGAPGTPTAFGIGGEVQLASHDFGLRLGLTPEQFLVHNWLGGLRWNPVGGPFTILLDRDSVRDTKLSFAGERDPNTQAVWGGVMASGVSVVGNWNQGNTGYYAKLGYQNLEGQTVATNSRIDANVGSYFKVYNNKAGDLTVGFNLSGMHYDQNLRYFTLGQGGYFSPQQYFLFNVPVRWNGSWNQRLQYSISASLGAQHFTEDASSYFPTDAARQAASGLSYPASTNTGGNYNLSVHSIYQIAPQWLGGAFFDVNNAREYRSVNAGLYLQYLFKPRPMSTDFNLKAVPDWTGAAPFGLP